MNEDRHRSASANHRKRTALPGSTVATVVILFLSLSFTIPAGAEKPQFLVPAVSDTKKCPSQMTPPPGTTKSFMTALRRSLAMWDCWNNHNQPMLLEDLCC
jgi:hypothetical protein